MASILIGILIKASTSRVQDRNDIQYFIILWQESGIQTLQVHNSHKQRINASPIPGTLLINIGDLLARWTSELLFRAYILITFLHPSSQRYSIAIFVGVDPHVRVEKDPLNMDLSLQVTTN
ncbi:hypothetical protein EDD17DRAFT_1071545 [Pisolithus thermaeus]|nr:hypothetical protein EDD17DRAFT_1071545 [Pisolithus thermaeus]